MTPLKYHNNKVLNPLIIERYNLNTLKELVKPKGITISSTSKKMLINKSLIFNTLILLELISNQAPTIIRAKQSIATFKLKKGTTLGGKVSLSSDLLWSFLEKLNLIILPQLKEFKGYSYSKETNFKAIELGIKDVTCFQEIESNIDKLNIKEGLTIAFLVQSNLSNTKIHFFMNGLLIPLNK